MTDKHSRITAQMLHLALHRSTKHCYSVSLKELFSCYQTNFPPFSNWFPIFLNCFPIYQIVFPCAQVQTRSSTYLRRVFVFFLYLVRCPTSYERAQKTRLHRYLTRAILHIASLAAHTTLNTYKPMEINIERSPQQWCPSRARTRNSLLTRTMP